MNNRFENFTFSILKAGKIIQKIKNIEVEEFNLKAVHVMCLYYLNQENNGLTNAELVKLTFEDKAAISRAAAYLKSKGYIDYDAKKYNAPLKITGEGKKVAEIIEERASNAVNAVGNIINDEERRNFYNTLNLLTNSLYEYYKKLEK